MGETVLGKRLYGVLAGIMLALPAAHCAPRAVTTAMARPLAGHFTVDRAELLPYFLYVPSNASPTQTVRVLVALHGMGADGHSFASQLIPLAEQYGVVLVGPTFQYGDWRDPDQVRREGAVFLPQLKALIDELPARTGLQVAPRIMVYGFSRGAQAAHRFAVFYPQAVQAVAAFSAGTYTLPEINAPPGPGSRQLPFAFPFGVADLDQYTGRPFDLPALRQVRFLVGVGAMDNQPDGLPRQWDPYLGRTRLERATNYSQVLRDCGVSARLVVIPNTGHVESNEMRTRAVAFLAE
jgi:pimeloyl-ACP methyl ester carboxylesterase